MISKVSGSFNLPAFPKCLTNTFFTPLATNALAALSTSSNVLIGKSESVRSSERFGVMMSARGMAFSIKRSRTPSATTQTFSAFGITGSHK